ncbi:MAG: HD domain-containing protein, partial [Gammaproteobacteria bacterium]|nr:HD domain-containing protein [Gammaproteobacteria bacterium]
MDLHYQRLFECAQDGILILDYPNGSIIDVNPFLCRILNYDRDFFIGKKLWEIGFIEDKIKAAAIFKELITTGYIRYENIDLRKASGDLMSVEFICNSYTVADNTVIQCNIRDITDRVKKISLEAELDTIKIHHLNSIISCLSAIIEARDPYTAGHQYRVADFAVHIARYMKLSEQKIIGIHLAAMLHDIGKFKIPLEILVNPRGLSVEESNLLKTHPQVGADILSTLKFEQNIVRFVLEHHERLDGSGYPNGLKQKQISIEARVIAVADVIESMNSFRPYRPALGIQQALKEVMKNQGILYDKDVVNAAI